jgi:hypothetical protein
VAKIIASIERVGFVEDEFTLWVVPEMWKREEPKAGDEKVFFSVSEVVHLTTGIIGKCCSPDDGRRREV